MADKKPSHKVQVYHVLCDGKPHRSDEITERMFGTSDTARTGLFHLPARIYDLRKEGNTIVSWKDHDHPCFMWYRLDQPKDIPLTPVPEYKGEGKQLQLLPACRQY